MGEDASSFLLVIYTGGSIGMIATPDGRRPGEGELHSWLRAMPQFNDVSFTTRKTEFVTPRTKFGKRICYDVKSFSPLVDSCNLDMTHWGQIAGWIQEHYHVYDAFVVLMGTDTMAYCASALSFMLDNLTKSVVLTGSQVPLAEQYSDGVLNLLGAMIIAGHFVIPEVTVYFDHKLLRGNRTTKTHASSFAAFDSPNLPPLAAMGVSITVEWDSILRPHGEQLRVCTSTNSNVGVLRLFPGITLESVQAFLQPPMQGVVLQTYGAGNGPSNRKDLLEAFRAACDAGVLIINCTQCLRGYVTDAYETGRALAHVGIIPGFDMTPEAALTKLAYVLGLDGLSLEQRRALMRQNLRGEMMVSRSQDGFSLHNAAFVNTLADVLVEGHLQTPATRALLPVVACCAARSGDTDLLARLAAHGLDLSAGDYDLRTPLHMAAAGGQADAVHFLLQRGVSVNAVDRHGKTAAHDAALAGHVLVVHMLRAHGGAVALSGVRLAALLIKLVVAHNTRVLSCFLAAGVDVNLRDCNGRTMLHWAVALSCRTRLPVPMLPPQLQCQHPAPV